MTLDALISGLIYLVSAYVLFWLGKVVFDLIHREFRVAEELLKKNNAALALALGGYYLGLVFAIGGGLTSW